MAEPTAPKEPNTLGNASLALGITSAALVFGIGLCAIVGAQQGWVQLLGTPLYVCGASSAFLGFIGVILGFAGLFGTNRSRATAITGLILGIVGICLFIGALAAVGGG
ncbi:MAG: hypothetical protein GTO18_21930 [Anaerolineales bacterium]|nr:hypothetical protein [Anaerolineales bacterium]